MNQAEAQYEKMTKTPVHRLINALSAPTIVSMLVTNLYNMADTYFVSQIGTSASGATGVVFGLMAILQAFGFMFGHGAGSNISRKLGSRNIQEAREYASNSFWLSILTGLVILILGLLNMDDFMRLLGSTETILPYAKDYAFWILLAGPAMTSSCVLNNILRYEGKAFYAMIGLTAGGILNIFGDAILINVFHMGICGAGLSTFASQYISMFILALPYLQKKVQSRLYPKDFTRRKEVVFNILYCGMPSLMRQGLNSVSTMFINHSAAFYGDAAVAAISISMRIANFLFCIAIGIGQGFQPVSAFNYGARIYSRVKEAFLYAMKSGTIILALLGILGWIFSEPLVQLFRNDPEVISVGARGLRWQACALPLMSYSTLSNMMLQAAGKGLKASITSSARSGIFFIPLILILPSLLGLSGVIMAQAIADVLAFLLCVPVASGELKIMRSEK